MEQEGNPDAHGFDDGAERQSLQLLAHGIVFVGADQDVAIGPEMLDQKDADGNDAGKRMEFSPEEAGLVFDFGGRHRQRCFDIQFCKMFRTSHRVQAPRAELRTPRQRASIERAVGARNRRECASSGRARGVTTRTAQSDGSH